MRYVCLMIVAFFGFSASTFAADYTAEAMAALALAKTKVECSNCETCSVCECQNGVCATGQCGLSAKPQPQVLRNALTHEEEIITPDGGRKIVTIEGPARNIAQSYKSQPIYRAPIRMSAGTDGHTHTCANGHTWSHVENPTHTCQICGLFQNEQDPYPRATRGYSRPTIQYSLSQYGGCANGQCSSGQSFAPTYAQSGWYPGKFFGRR